MKKYLAEKISVSITEVEIDRETQSCVILPNGRREAKDTNDWRWYRDTREEAKECLLNYYQKQLDALENQIKYLKEKLEQAKAL